MTRPLAWLAAAVLWGACGPKQELTAPPPPLRPEAEAEDDKPALTVRKDCDPTGPDDEPAKMGFTQRSIPEASRLTEEARAMLKTAESAEVDRSLREQYTSDAVIKLITALQADPYNVAATYSLAATYARIGRKQCAINLLTRLLQMRPHPSKRPEVEAHLDRLLGRKQALDPNFAEMRRDIRFRDLIKKMCDGTNDPNCVYGAQRDNRER
jgi:thioredoxin-like negative regulator of GroEL